MVVPSAILSVLALGSAYLAAHGVDANVVLPWDGRGCNLTVKTLTNKYMTHILTMRNNRTDGDVSKYVSIEPKARASPYNGDSAIINIGVDKDAIFKEQFNFRRSELVQQIDANDKGTTYFRVSMMNKKHFYNNCTWQLFFDEAHTFEIRIDVAENKLIYLNGGTWDSKWDADFEVRKWYNFGLSLSPSTSTGTLIRFYMSTDNEDLVLTRTHVLTTEVPKMYELHAGLLTLSKDNSAPKMNAKPDIMSFNGVSAGTKVELSAKVSVKGCDGICTTSTKN